MFNHLIPGINQDLKRTNKAIISLGCSFVQGHGALDDNIYRDFKWEWEFNKNGLKWIMNHDDRIRLTQEYSDIHVYSPNSPINFSDHENNNSFVNLLCKKYFDGKYTPINLGRSGNGNRATIKDLYFYPDILWDDINEIIVIYCPSGPERVDFINDSNFTLNDHNRWISAWPHVTDGGCGARNHLWTGIRESLDSDKFQALEQITHVQELMLWCKYKNAKLIIVPAFMQNVYMRDTFIKNIRTYIIRSETTELEKVRERAESDHLFNAMDEATIQRVADMWPWESMFYPDDCPSFADYVQQQEYGTWEKAPYFYTHVGKGSPDFWISPCAHPSKKGHDAFAKKLYEHILSM